MPYHTWTFLILPQLIHAPDSLLTTFHATPSQALQIHAALRARHSLAMHFATFAGSDFEAIEPIIELEQAKRDMEAGVDRQGSKDKGEGEGEGVRARSVGDWWMEGGMGVIDIGETAVVHVGKTPSSHHRT
jgi:hypothetical protein